ncbi:MAG TPA: ABC transporter substrate-binding protein [Candidatus Binatia bacterium]|nr:ABC transporter substrate-binding protein [Candidatus Binatia bacterium]
MRSHRSSCPRPALLGLSIALAALAMLSTRLVAATDAPKEVVRRMSDAVIAVLQEKDLSADAKREKIRGIVEGYVDFQTMSRLVLARNWRELDDGKKKDFVEEFKRHLSVTYGKNVESYNNEKVQITGERDEGRGDWTVQSKILRPQGGGDILVDYRLRELNGEWKVIDLVIERVSLVSSFRSQFQEVMANGGIDRLLELLREKNAAGQPLKS